MKYFKTTGEVKVVNREDGSVKNYYVGREGGRPLYLKTYISTYSDPGNMVHIDNHGRPWVLANEALLMKHLTSEETRDD